MVKAFLIVALVKTLLATDKPFLCSGVYAGILFLFGLMFGSPFDALLIASLITFALASLYFWLLDRLDDGSFSWWVIVLGGLIVLLFV